MSTTDTQQGHFTETSQPLFFLHRGDRIGKLSISPFSFFVWSAACIYMNASNILIALSCSSYTLMVGNFALIRTAIYL